jgi:hypothetical protein
MIQGIVILLTVAYITFWSAQMELQSGKASGCAADGYNMYGKQHLNPWLECWYAKLQKFGFFLLAKESNSSFATIIVLSQTLAPQLFDRGHWSFSHRFDEPSPQHNILVLCVRNPRWNFRSDRLYEKRWFKLYGNQQRQAICQMICWFTLDYDKYTRDVLVRIPKMSLGGLSKITNQI